MGGAMRLWLLAACVTGATNVEAQDKASAAVQFAYVETHSVKAELNDLAVCLANGLTWEFRTWLRRGLIKDDPPGERLTLLTAQSYDNNELPFWQLRLKAIDSESIELSLYVPQDHFETGEDTAKELAPSIADCVTHSPPRGQTTWLRDPAAALAGCWRRTSYKSWSRLPPSVTLCFKPRGQLTGMSVEGTDGWDWKARWKLYSGRTHKIAVAQHTCTLGFFQKPKAILLTDCEMAGAFNWNGTE